MFAWIVRRKYRREVLARVAAAFEPAPNYLRHLKLSYPGIVGAIDNGFNEKRSREALAVNIAGAVLSDTIEQIADSDRRHRIAHDLQNWLEEPECNVTLWLNVPLAKRPPDVDPIQWKLRWAVTYVSNLYERKLIDRQSEDFFYSEIFGALAGKPPERRHSERISKALSDSLGLSAMRD